MTGTHLRITLLPEHVQRLEFHSQNQKGKKKRNRIRKGKRKRKALYPSNIPLPKRCGRGAGSHTSRVPPLPPHLQVLPARAPRPPVLRAGRRSSRPRPHGPQLTPVSPGRVAYTSMLPPPRRTQPLEVKNLTLRRGCSAHRLCVCVTQGTLGPPRCMPGLLQGTPGSSLILGARTLI